jgi:imidazoleglycerol-phosphate dehydratase
MLTLFSKYSFFDLELNAIGDLHVDAHHTVEDIGIVLGQAIKSALGEKKAIKRYGSSFLPMDEALSLVSIDLGGRPYFVFDAVFPSEKVGDMDTELFEEFFRAVSVNAAMNLHIKVFYGSNCHHIIESIFKAFGRSFDEAIRLDERLGNGVLSTKGVL